MELKMRTLWLAQQSTCPWAERQSRHQMCPTLPSAAHRPSLTLIECVFGPRLFQQTQSLRLKILRLEMTWHWKCWLLLEAPGFASLLQALSLLLRSFYSQIVL